MDEHGPESEPHTIGLRQLLGAVNLRDFAQMVGAEIIQIGTSARLAFESLTRLPLGPAFFVVGMLIVLLRSILLALVIVAFGGGIVAITVSRGLLKLLGGRSKDGAAPGGGDEA